jgi:hypothetical protein
LSSIHYILILSETLTIISFSVIPDDSPAHEPIIDIVESNASPVDGMVESSSSIGLTPLSLLGISKPLFANKSSLITYRLFTTFDFNSS